MTDDVANRRLREIKKQGQLIQEGKMEVLTGINWTQVLTVLISTSFTAAIALRTLRQSHHLTLERDTQNHERQKNQQQHTAEELRRRERHFISTELIFILETFAMDCASVATDEGILQEKTQPKVQKVICPIHQIPKISFADVDGDWRALNTWEMFRTREIPILLQDAHMHIVNRTENLLYGADSSEILRIRGEAVSPVGLRAASVARKLRRQCDFPISPLSEGEFSATRTLQKVRKRQIRRECSKGPENDSDQL